MGKQRTVQIDVDGLTALVSVNEVTPGRWAWKVTIEGQPTVAGSVPSPNERGAIIAATEAVRQHEALAQPPAKAPGNPLLKTKGPAAN